MYHPYSHTKTTRQRYLYKKTRIQRPGDCTVPKDAIGYATRSQPHYQTLMIKRNSTREVKIGGLVIGANHPIAVQSMCATPTTDIPATLKQLTSLSRAGADIIRIAVDNKKDANALIELRAQSDAILSVDLQENYH